jgi:TRAP-type C4-dicarboxylate transport system substrate-binding protein
MKRSKWMAFIVIASFFIAVPGYGLELKIATLSPEGSAWMQKMQAGADEIHRKTNKRVRFKFFGGGIMGNDDAVLRKIRIGQLHGGAVTAGSLSHLYGDGIIYGLPMKFKSLQEIDRVRKKMDPILMEGFEKSGFVTFGLAEGGFAYLMSNNPIRTTADLRTHKVWIPGNDLITAEVLKRVGVNPIPLPIADVLTSLQTGLVDTIPAPPIAAIILQWHTRVRYLTEIPLSYAYGLLAVDRKAFAKIAPEDQQIVRDVMQQVFKDIDHQNRKDHITAMKVLQKNGIQFVQPTPEAQVEWRAAGLEVTQKLLEKGLISRQALDQLDSLLKENIRLITDKKNEASNS